MHRLSYTEVASNMFKVHGVADPSCFAEVDISGIRSINNGLVEEAPDLSSSDSDSGLVPQIRSNMRRARTRRNRGVVENPIVEAVIDAIEDICAPGDDHADDGLGEDGLGDEPPDNDSSESASEGGDADEHVAPPDMVVTPANCIDASQAVSIDDLEAELPDFKTTHRWEVLCQSTGKVVAQTRMISGRSLKISCNVHGPRESCKMHENINHDMHRLDAELMKWAIAGTTVTADEHGRLGVQVSDRWRSRR